MSAECACLRCKFIARIRLLFQCREPRLRMNGLVITSQRNKVPQYVGTVSVILVMTILTLAAVAPMHVAGLQPHSQTNVGDTVMADQASLANVQEGSPTLASMKLKKPGFLLTLT